MITQQQLTAYLGQPISQICQNGFANANDNHCAHFVAHALGYQFGVTCRTMSNGHHPGANIRVQEIFPLCTTVGTWDSRPLTLTPCLVFITRASNVNLTAKVMSNVPRKHIGIYLNGWIWHYSNSQHKVVQQIPHQFAQHYAPPDNAMFFGSLP